MNGKEQREEKIRNRIYNILDNEDNSVKGYYSFIGTSRALSTRFQYVKTVSLFLRKTNKKINDLTLEDFSYYVSSLYDKRTSSYAITSHAALKLYSKYLYVSDIIPKDYMQYVDRPKYKETIETKEKREKGYLTKREIKKLMDALENGIGTPNAKIRQAPYKNRDKLIVLLFLTTGMRLSGLISINVEDIKFNEKSLSVYEKGEKISEFTLSDDIIDCVNKWLVDREKLLNGIQEDALFISANRCRIGETAVRDLIKKFTSCIYGKNITPHKLRATFGTQIYKATKDIYYTQQCMHHNSPKTTELYIRGDAKDTSKSADIMANIIKGNKII